MRFSTRGRTWPFLSDPVVQPGTDRTLRHCGKFGLQEASSEEMTGRHSAVSHVQKPSIIPCLFALCRIKYFDNAC